MAFEDLAKRMAESRGQAAPPPLERLPEPGDAYRAEHHSAATKDIVFGLILLIIGIAITAATHESAVNQGGGTYVVAYGPIVVGVIKLFRGIARLAR